MRVRVLVAALAALLVPAQDAASSTLPVGQADGVRVEREGALLRFAPEPWKRVAGRRLRIICAARRETTTLTTRAPRHGRVIKTVRWTFVPNPDYCRVVVAGPKVDYIWVKLDQIVASVPLTQRGARYLAEEGTAFDLISLIAAAQPVIGGPPGYPLPEELVEDMRALSPDGPPVVALASPQETPPIGTFGYYSDGAEHAAAVAVAATGRRMLLELDAGDTIRTNVLGYLFADALDGLLLLPQRVD